MASTTSSIAFGNAYKSVQANNINGSVHIGLENTLDRLPRAKDAPFNSFAKQHEPACLADTRVDLLQEIYSWADGQDERCIFWLSGLAGTGKSTIARTVARSYYDKQRLAASFFFSRGGGDVGHAGKFVTSIAVQLARNVPALKQRISDAVAERDDIASQSLRDQWQHLVLRPLSKLHELEAGQRTYIIVVDALDECDNDSNIRIIVQLLAEVRSSLTGARLRVLLTSRPEVPIRHGFCQVPETQHQDVVLHNISRSIVDHDIALFLEYNLQLIAQERCLRAGWPGAEIVVQLVQSASGLFIWAATACRFIREGKGLAVKKLETILYNRDTTSITPEKHLNEIYTTVLKNSIQDYADEDKEEQCRALQYIIGSIVVLFSPLSAQSLDQLLDVAEGVGPTLADLHAILDIPNNRSRPVRLHHPSFRDFLLDRKRCGDDRLYVDKKSTHEKLASCCLKLMSAQSGLRQDLCNLSDPGVLQREIDEETIHHNLPPELQYACRYWVDHLERSGRSVEDGDATHHFLEKHLLHWLEAMSLLDETSLCVRLLARLQALATPSNSVVAKFLHDAVRFVLRFVPILAKAPLQIYSSALLFSPESSLVRKVFIREVPQAVKVISGRDAEWDACRSVLESHSASVRAVVFSPDGQLVASASWDSIVRVWETATGHCRSVLEGHSREVNAVVFSPDGQLVASASADSTVRVWETATGHCRSVLEGHSREVNAVVFSPDRQLVASVSWDSTVRVWETATGQCHSVLEGHSGSVNAVVFSPDGQLVASASNDRTVRVWETATGRCRSVLEGHSFYVRAVVFSPDGQLVASASGDSTVRVWETATGQCHSVLEGHSDGVSAVVFSPDGQLVASASWDSTVRVWETATGHCRSVLEGHSASVIAVVFSPDGQLVASASDDSTVRVWEAATGHCRTMLEGHSYRVGAVVFSPDGQLVASASDDSTVRVWEAATGQCHSVLESHSEYVNAVMFSPDGQLVASASGDSTVRVWETATGHCRTVLEGHSGSVIAVVFSPDGQLVASASWDSTVRVWETATGHCRSVLEGHSREVNAVVFSPDGQLVASASWDSTVRVWETATGQCHSVLEGHSDVVTAVVFSPDGQLVASASWDSTVRVWETATGQCRTVLEGHSDGVGAVVFSPDGQLVASASRDSTVRVWETATGHCRSVLEGHSEYVNAVVFSPDGQLVALASDDRTVRVWETATGHCRTVLEDQPSPIFQIAFSPDGRTLHTNKGDIPLPLDLVAVASALLAQELLYAVVDGEWVLLQTRRFLWLPPQYRNCVMAVYRHTIAMRGV
ncbi:vegetative incompatibility protein HET-E-1 [Bipolaris maydis]|nr:vegetative incompatibility protein HET-E-1 [Bipolaris maydis]